MGHEPALKATTHHTVLFSDSRRLAGIADGSIDLVVTSPPYPLIEMWDGAFSAMSAGAAQALGDGDGPRAFEACHAELDRVWAECFGVLRTGGHACVNVGDAVRTIGGEFRLYSNHARILSAMTRLGFSALPDILWRKQTNAPNKFMGSGMLPAGAYVTYEHEYVLVFRKGGLRRFATAQEKENRRRSAYFWEERNAWFSDVWTDLKGAGQELADARSRARSGAFPFELAYRLVNMYSVYGDTVLDPFLGTGTTCAAAIASMRNSVGVESDAGLRAAIRSALLASVAAGRERSARRLLDHRAFVEARLAKGLAVKHRNAGHDVPVVTAQERDLVLTCPVAVREVEEMQFEAEHAELGPALPAPSPGHEERLVQGELLPAEDAGGTLLRWSAGEAGTQAPAGLGEAEAALGGGTETVDETPPAGADPGQTPGLRPAADGKYRMGRELGRGGLGRVVEAVDADFGRSVAVKMMLPGAVPSGHVERFLLEARAAGRLSHPNIVPVHEIGVLGQGPDPSPYFTMTKIVGQDLGRILSDLDAGDERATGRFNRPRLLGVFQDVCNAIAYAHDHGVIHRDLKPSNVMVGDYGEVYVVDWGLAKIIGHGEPSDRSDRSDRSDAALAQVEGRPIETLEGQILGTPAYMPPEQAAGRVAGVDERSDLYSLGAILYEILTLRPPFEGATGREVIAKVLRGRPEPPSARAFAVRREKEEALAGGPATEGPRDPRLPEPVPPDLDEVCLKALSREKEKRFASARELHDEIRKFLEGEKERERNRERALAKVAEGRVLLESMEKARAEAEALEKEVREQEEAIKPHWPASRKKDFWALQERVKVLRERVVKDFTAAQGALQEALGFERRNPEARAALAGLYWAEFLRAEEKDDRSGMVLYEGLVRQYNDGAYDERLRGDGTLSVSTRFYPCRCLSEGRMVSPRELGGCVGSRVECGVSGVENADEGAPVLDTRHSTLDTSRRGILGYHPTSGRALDGREGAEGVPELEPRGPIRLRVHGAECRPAPLEGADVWLFRFEERDRILVPVMPTDAAVGATGRSPLPAVVLGDVLDRLYDPASPFRPTEGRYLGKTPIARFRIPMGSYLLVLARPPAGSPGGSPSRCRGEGEVPAEPPASSGFRPVRVPVLIGRNANESVDVTLYREDETPAGFVQVPAGPFVFQGDRECASSGPREVRETDDFLIGKFPVTCWEYLEFLNDLASRKPDEAARRVPRASEKAGFYWPRVAGGTYAVPTAAWLAGAPEDAKRQARRLAQAPAEFEEDWPVFGVSWEDALAFASWWSKKNGFLASLPHEVMWEKAARGADGRFHPFGNRFDDTWANTLRSHDGPPRPFPVDSYPLDEGPCGARGLCGNAVDWCLNDVEDGRRRLLKGASWLLVGMHERSAGRQAGSQANVCEHVGFRLAVLRRVGRGAHGGHGESESSKL